MTEYSNTHICKEPECELEVQYLPEENVYVLTDLNKMEIPNKFKEVVVNIYLTCENGHTHPYKIQKSY